MKTNNLGLYIHIPFCIKKCKYCDFISFEGCSSEAQTMYVRELLKEIEYYGSLYKSGYIVDTIFIGGGTPTVLSEALINDVMDAINRFFNIGDQAEITIEANPGTLTAEKLRTCFDTGINRLSIGVQSLDEKMLRNLGRIHTVEDFLKNYRLARDTGFANINVDLMFAIPGHNMEIWTDTLAETVALGPEHISFYSLQIEENTMFYDMLKHGEICQIPDELDRDMYHKAIEILNSAGYRHYEISNAAKAGFECRHNLKYWSMEDYLGIGLGAHSFMDGVRFSNTRDLNAYLRGIRVDWQHRNTLQDSISEYIFTGMRKTAGISLSDFQRKFGKSIFDYYPEQKKIIDGYVKDNYIIIDGDIMKFTVKGIDLSNIILAEFV